MSDNNETITITVQRIPGTPKRVEIERPFTVGTVLDKAGLTMNSHQEASVGDQTISKVQAYATGDQQMHELEQDDNVYLVQKTKGNENISK